MALSGVQIQSVYWRWRAPARSLLDEDERAMARVMCDAPSLGSRHRVHGWATEFVPVDGARAW